MTWQERKKIHYKKITFAAHISTKDIQYLPLSLLHLALQVAASESKMNHVIFLMFVIYWKSNKLILENNPKKIYTLIG